MSSTKKMLYITTALTVILSGTNYAQAEGQSQSSALMAEIHSGVKLKPVSDRKPASEKQKSTDRGFNLKLLNQVKSEAAYEDKDNDSGFSSSSEDEWDDYEGVDIDDKVVNTSFTSDQSKPISAESAGKTTSSSAKASAQPATTTAVFKHEYKKGEEVLEEVAKGAEGLTEAKLKIYFAINAPRANVKSLEELLEKNKQLQTRKQTAKTAWEQAQAKEAAEQAEEALVQAEKTKEAKAFVAQQATVDVSENPSAKSKLANILLANLEGGPVPTAVKHDSSDSKKLASNTRNKLPATAANGVPTPSSAPAMSKVSSGTATMSFAQELKSKAAKLNSTKAAKVMTNTQAASSATTQTTTANGIPTPPPAPAVSKVSSGAAKMSFAQELKKKVATLNSAKAAKVMTNTQAASSATTQTTAANGIPTPPPAPAVSKVSSGAAKMSFAQELKSKVAKLNSAKAAKVLTNTQATASVNGTANNQSGQGKNTGSKIKNAISNLNALSYTGSKTTSSANNTKVSKLKVNHLFKAKLEGITKKAPSGKISEAKKMKQSQKNTWAEFAAPTPIPVDVNQSKYATYDVQELKKFYSDQLSELKELVVSGADENAQLHILDEAPIAPPPPPVVTDVKADKVFHSVSAAELQQRAQKLKKVKTNDNKPKAELQDEIQKAVADRDVKGADFWENFEQVLAEKKAKKSTNANRVDFKKRVNQAERGLSAEEQAIIAKKKANLERAAKVAAQNKSKWEESRKISNELLATKDKLLNVNSDKSENNNSDIGDIDKAAQNQNRADFLRQELEEIKQELISRGVSLEEIGLIDELLAHVAKEGNTADTTLLAPEQVEKNEKTATRDIANDSQEKTEKQDAEKEQNAEQNTQENQQADQQVVANTNEREQAAGQQVEVLVTEKAETKTIVKDADNTAASLIDVNEAENRLINQVIQARFNNLGMAAGEEEVSRARGLWVKGLYNISNQTAHDKFRGYKGKTYGVAIGADAQITDHTTVGIAVGHMNSKFTFKGKKANDKSKASGNSVSLYGIQQLSSNWSVDGILSFIQTRVKLANMKPVNINGEEKLAKAKYKVNGGGLDLNFKYHKMFDNGASLVPVVGINYLHNTSSSFTESNSGIFDVAVSSRKTQTLKGKVGAILNFATITKDNTLITPSVSAIVERNIYSKFGDLHLKNAHVNRKHEVNKKQIDKNSLAVNLGAGIEIKHNNMSISTNYNGMFKKKHNSHTGSIKLRIDF